MSCIEKSMRQAVVFDPKNKNHRKLYQEVCQEKSWGKSPIRFILEPEYLDLLSMIRDKLSKYYVEKEFNKKGA